MSHSLARHESQQTVNSLNLFVDSERASKLGHADSKGDDVKVHFEGNSIHAQDGEIIRVSLTNFTMFNNLYHIDVNNSRFVVRNDNTDTESIQFIARKNYQSVDSIAAEFGNAVGAGIVVVSPNTITYTSTSVASPTTLLGETGDRLLDITVTMSGAHGIAEADLAIQCLDILGDTYCVLGGERLDTTGGNSSSFEVTVPTTSTVRIKGYFPMQRMTDPYVYLRCDTGNNGLEMSVLDSARIPNPTMDVVHSNIIGKVFRDVEFINYTSIGSEEYFINLQQRRLSTLRLFLTDSKGRRLGRLSSAGQDGTAAGKETGGAFDKKTQSTLGNLFFTCVLRIDTIRVSIPRSIGSEPPPLPLPAREAQGVVVWPDYGRPKY